jgi:alginate O-acetyltransferase complex protein AlgI
MLFFEGQFLVFLVVVLLLSAACMTHVRVRAMVMLIASYVFYAAWEPRFLLLIFGCTVVDFVIARWMPGAEPRRKKRLMAASLLLNLGSLALFKYADFGVASFNALVGAEVPLLALTLPVGISFFTFQSMSYTIDVYRGVLEPEPDFWSFALFVSFFPQLVAGPIIRAADYFAQANTALRTTIGRVWIAAPLFVFGLFKKVVIADRLGPIVDMVYADPSAFSSGDRWMATLAFAGQIYCDFSGYTDMALGLCILLGFDFPLNFRSPYLSLGPQDFWRRWHISLSTWLRDYLYIPLGGSRFGIRRMYVALFLTMLLGGLWHGAAWTFVIWGAYHGTLLILERLVAPPPKHPRIRDVVWRWPVFFVLTLLGWLCFRAQSWTGMLEMLDGLWRWQPATGVPLMIIGACMAYVGVEHILGELNRRHRWTERYELVAVALAGLLLPLCFLLRPDKTSDFIYFQF